MMETSPPNSEAYQNQEWLLNSYMEQMTSQQPHSNTALSWRRLFLTRAKLKASSRISALLSGFAMVAMVEINIDAKDKDDKLLLPEWLLILFGLCTLLLVTCHLMALMISTCILPNIEAVSSFHSSQIINESPHDQMRVYIEMAWIFSTGVGILLFLAEIVILCWVKFLSIKKPKVAIMSTVIVIPAALLFIVFSLVYYKKLMAHKSQRHAQMLDEMAQELQRTADGHNVV